MSNTLYNIFPTVSNGKIGGEQIQTVNARDLHAFLENGDKFATWIKDKIETYNFVENQDFMSFSENTEKPKGGRPSKEYAISLDMAKELAMVERNEKGKQARQYFIECERRAKDPVAALNDPSTLKNLLLDNVEKVIALEAHIKANEPKTTFFDKYVNADGLYGLQNAGRALSCRPNLFVRWLKENYLFYQGSNLVARVQYIQMGIFEVKMTIVDDKARAQTYITPKGIEYLSKRLPDSVRFQGAA
ncbi:antA/AntB antirepressor family protein [uncultured Bartonella sp.]|uniref:antA/AntB antirepressor family protein n=1 Tax=uncultured Bartonella sp. TaxID=104108 RepID=UPI001436EA84|nr:antA/AntB antirepressor family protein [uncultured Bartonella sp.]QHJ82924.1 MAG: hypothetical protein [Bacteriophage sp.]